MPSHRHCIVPRCANRHDSCKFGLFVGEDGRYFKARLCGSRSTSSGQGRQGCRGESAVCKGVSYHRLPLENQLRKQWIAAIPRANTPISANSYICGQHFVEGRRRCYKDVPTIFEGRKACRPRRSFASTGRLERLEVSDAAAGHSPCLGDLEINETERDEGVPPCPPVVAADIEKALEDRTLRDQVRVLQAQLEESQKEAAKHKLALEETLAKANAFGFAYASKDDKVFKFYTGIHVQDFVDLNHVLGDSADDMKYYGTAESAEHEGRYNRGRARKLSREDELFLTLIKLRHDFPESDLAARFNVSQATISRVFRTWVLCLSYTFKEIDIWPSRIHVNNNMPDAFSCYASTRVIIDATEFPIEKPSKPDIQATTWSSYKNRNTLKVLVGCSPNGVLTFLSDVYGGRITDKEITRRSGLTAKLESGDTIMADRGFEIDDMLPEGVRCNIPPFLGGRDQLEPLEVLETRRIATLRIHVERAIERLKNFQILSFIPLSLFALAQPIVNACAFLTLFDEPLVPVGGQSRTHIRRK